MMCAAGGAVLHPDGDAAGPSGRLLQRPRHRRSVGALMLSVLLGTAFLSRQVWGAISDRIGGLATVLIGSAWQARAMTAFLLTQDEAGLFTVAAAFGLGFSGIIPAYVLALRELFPASEASWRIPTLLLFSGLGMAARRLARRPALRSLRLLRAGLRRRHRRQYPQSAGGRHAGDARTAARGLRLRLARPIIRTPTRMPTPIAAGPSAIQVPAAAKRRGCRPGDRGERLREGRNARGGLAAAELAALAPARGTRAGSPVAAAAATRMPSARDQRRANGERSASAATNGANTSAIAPITASILARSDRRAGDRRGGDQIGRVLARDREPGEPAGELAGRHHQHRHQHAPARRCRRRSCATAAAPAAADRGAASASATPARDRAAAASIPCCRSTRAGERGGSRAPRRWRTPRCRHAGRRDARARRSARENSAIAAPSSSKADAEHAGERARDRRAPRAPATRRGCRDRARARPAHRDCSNGEARQRAVATGSRRPAGR